MKAGVRAVRKLSDALVDEFSGEDAPKPAEKRTAVVNYVTCTFVTQEDYFPAESMDITPAESAEVFELINEAADDLEGVKVDIITSWPALHANDIYNRSNALKRLGTAIDKGSLLVMHFNSQFIGELPTSRMDAFAYIAERLTHHPQRVVFVEGDLIRNTWPDRRSSLRAEITKRIRDHLMRSENSN